MAFVRVDQPESGTFSASAKFTFRNSDGEFSLLNFIVLYHKAESTHCLVKVKLESDLMERSTEYYNCMLQHFHSYIEFRETHQDQDHFYAVVQLFIIVKL